MQFQYSFVDPKHSDSSSKRVQQNRDATLIITYYDS